MSFGEIGAWCLLLASVIGIVVVCIRWRTQARKHREELAALQERAATWEKAAEKYEQASGTGSLRSDLAQRVARLGMWEWDPATGLFALSDGAAGMMKLGLTPSSITPEEMDATIHPEDREKATSVRKRVLSFGGVFEHEFRRLFADGSVCWYRECCQAEMQDKTVLRVSGAMLDITLKKELAIQRDRAQAETNAALAAKAEFLTNMSHEIRTPMNDVMGMSSLLLCMELPVGAVEYATAIYSSAERLLAVLNDILLLSAAESGNIQLERIPVSLPDCLEESAELFAMQAAQKGLEMAVEVEPAISDWIYSDPALLRQIAMNLIGNAVKFTQVGEISVTAKKVRVNDKHDYVQIDVRDSGIGIPLDQDRLFRSFSQGDSSTTRPFGGTGLGLAISKRLTERLGGTMKAAQQPDGGSIFSFTIPHEPAPAQKVRPTAQRDWAGKKVLVGIPNRTVRGVVERYLERWKFAPSGTVSLGELNSRMESQTWDLVVVDQALLDSFGEMEHWKGLGKGLGKVPSIVLHPARETNGKRIPTDGQLLEIAKPLKRDLFYQAIGRAFGGAQEPNTSRRPLGAEFALQYPLRILLAEDNPVNRKVAVRLLERWGYSPEVACNGQEALEALRRESYDVVFLDVHMPRMDGLTAARIICAEFGQEFRPYLVALTAGAMKEDRDRCLAAGMDNFLSKPLQIQELQTILERRAAVTPRGGLKIPPPQPTDLETAELSC